MKASIIDIVDLCIDIPMFLFHLLMTIFLFTKIIKKHAKFNVAFYQIFLIGAIVDLLAHIQVYMELSHGVADETAFIKPVLSGFDTRLRLNFFLSPFDDSFFQS